MNSLQVSGQKAHSGYYGSSNQSIGQRGTKVPQSSTKAEVFKMKEVKTFTKADNGKLSKVLEYESGARVEIPINKDGSVKFFDDSKLLKAKHK